MRWPDPEQAERSAGRIPAIYRWLADRIAPFQPADGPPPDRLRAFMSWALRGADRQILLAILASISVGVTQVLGMYLIGWVMDTAQSAGTGILRTHGWHFAALAAFFLIVWPASMVLNAAFNTVVLGPNLYALALSRINRHTLGQALSFFDNDFAGRIAQKSQQTARALTDVVLEGTNILGNAAAAGISAAVLLAAVDWRLGLAVLLWIAAYGMLIRAFLPGIRKRSQLRAARRAVVTG